MSFYPKPNVSYMSVETEASGSTTPPSYHDEPAPTVHWKVPTIMASSLLVGLAFAIAHGLFYANFNHKPVSTTSQQQWVIRAGTAFAFSSKLAWTTCCGTAFVQYFWLVVRRRSHNIKHIDSFFCALNNPLSLLNFRSWLRSPALAIPVVVILYGSSLESGFQS